jgi:Zn-dependent peptidase ImmA (M78 family)
MLSWLEDCARKIRQDEAQAVNLDRILDHFGISLQILINKGLDNHGGSLRKDSNDSYKVFVEQSQDNFLTNRTRFTIAHEIGHFLLIQKYDYHPSPENKREYRECEDLCNKFATALLIDSKAIASLEITSPQQLIKHAQEVSKTFKVSLEVAAQEIVFRHSDIGLFLGGKTIIGKPSKHKVHQRMVFWGHSSIMRPACTRTMYVENGKTIQSKIIEWLSDKLSLPDIRKNLTISSKQLAARSDTVMFGLVDKKLLPDR